MSDQTGAMHLTDANFAETVKKAGMKVMVDFYADWCGPCQMAAPIIDKLAAEYQGKILITKVNVDENPETAQGNNVMSIPTVIVVEADANGNITELKRQVGFAGEGGYRQMIEAVL